MLLLITFILNSLQKTKHALVVKIKLTHLDTVVTFYCYVATAKTNKTIKSRLKMS